MLPSFASHITLDLLRKKPSKKSTKSDLKPGILAFRTITTMLSLIQCPTETTKIEPLHISKDDRKELMVLDALAALLIRNYEKVAIMAEPFDGKSIRVISIVSLNNPESAVTKPSRSIRWFASLNSRYTPPLFPENKEDPMRVVDPDTKIHQKLSEHKNNPEELFNSFLLTQWGIESFNTHAWILKSLLQQSKCHLEILQLYVVAADFKKMLARMNHPVSTHYLAYFQKLKSMTFQPIEEMSTKPYDRNDALFLDDIPILAEVANTKIPNLMKMAHAAKDQKPLFLYNKDTCMEFHEILCELLERFHQSLIDLKNVEKLKVKKRKDDGCISQSDLEVIKDVLDRVLSLGRALRAIVRGSSIKVHLATIAPFLELRTGKFWPLAYGSEDDAEFRLLKPYSTDGHNEPLLPQKSFHDWLRLMVHHFDAIHVLDHHLMNLKSSSPIDISIMILYPSLPDGNMLTWKELIENEKYFPPIPHTPDQPSAADLISFLASTTIHEDDIIDDLILDIKKRQTSIVAGTVFADFTEYIQLLTEELNELKDSSSDGWKDYVVDILKQVDALERDSTTHDQSSRLDYIANMLENLKGSFSLYKKVQPGTPLSLGTGFIGSVHCEACAAVLNSLSLDDGLSEGLEEFKTTGHLLGVSKRCCPICARLLSLLKANNQDSFLTTGNHSTISACTLPESLPQKIIDQMVMEFGLRLRKELVNLQKTNEVRRARVRTNDTRRMSMESLQLTEREHENRGLSKALKSGIVNANEK